MTAFREMSPRTAAAVRGDIVCCLVQKKCDLAPICIDQTVLTHVFHFPHHSAAVGTDIVCQGTDGERKIKGVGTAARRLKGEIAQELVPDGAAAEDEAEE